MSIKYNIEHRIRRTETFVKRDQSYNGTLLEVIIYINSRIHKYKTFEGKTVRQQYAKLTNFMKENYPSSNLIVNEDKEI